MPADDGHLQQTYVIEVAEVDAIDGDPAGYVATNDELGLVVEADSLDSLKLRVGELAQDLFDLNVKPRLSDVQVAMPPVFVMEHRLRTAV